MRSRTRWLTTGFCALSVLCASDHARAADKVLIVQWPTNNAPLSNAAGPIAHDLLVGLGYDVTLSDFSGTTVPANVSDFKQVYLISIGLTGDADAAKLVTYVQGGGHLYVTGDRPDPTNDLESQLVQEKILKLVLKNSSTLQVGTGVEGGGVGIDLITLLPEATGVASHPNALTSFYMGDLGIIAGVDPSHVFAVDAANHPAGAVWTQADLVQGDGCVMLMEDINWWDLYNEVTQPPPDKAAVTQMAANVSDFMKYCGDHDMDGILDGAEPPVGTDPLNPDTDGDGLCDGTKTVNDPSITQKCIAGENGGTKQDSDGDGTIDALDPDDDNDGIMSKDEVADEAKFGDPDKDNIHAWLDLDSDNDGVSDHDEGRKHFNQAGVPDYLDPDYPTVGGGKGPDAGSDGGLDADGGTTPPTTSGCGCGVESSNSPSNAITFAGVLLGLNALLSRRRRVSPKIIDS